MKCRLCRCVVSNPPAISATLAEMDQLIGEALAEAPSCPDGEIVARYFSAFAAIRRRIDQAAPALSCLCDSCYHAEKVAGRPLRGWEHGVHASEHLIPGRLGFDETCPFCVARTQRPAAAGRRALLLGAQGGTA